MSRPVVDAGDILDRLQALAAENARLRAILETIRDAIVHRRSISGHVDYRPLRDFVEEALNGPNGLPI
jgi:hypothetical protein